MRKRQKNLLIAFGSLVAVALIFLVLWSLGLFDAKDAEVDDTAPDTTVTQPTEEIDPALIVYDRTHNAQGGAVSKPVEAVKIVNKSGSFNIITRSDNTMAVEAYSDLLADVTALDSVCGYAAKLVASKVLEPVEDAAQFGFDAPTATVTTSFYDGTSHTLLIGIASQGTEGYYVRMADADTVYIVSGEYLAGFLAEGKSYVGKSLISSPPINEGDNEGVPQLLKLWLTGRVRSTPVEIAVDTEGAYIGMTYVSNFVMKSPYVRAVDSDSFHTMASTMRTLTAAGVEMPHPSVDQLEEYGLSDPYSVAAFTLSIVSSASVDGGGSTSKHYNDREHMIILGNQNEDGYYYALVDGYDTVYLLDPAAVPWAKSTHFDLMSKLLFMKAITTVDTITITENGKATAFDLEHRPDEETRDAQMVVTAGGKTYGTRDFRTLYQMMIGIKRVAQKEAGATASGTPILQFKLTFADGSAPMSLALYPMSANRYLCVTDDGEETAVSISDVDTFLKQYANYLNGDPVLSPY